MKPVFVDTLLWVALAHAQDPWHSKARAAYRSVPGLALLTTQEVLSEFLTALSANPHLRKLSLAMYERVRVDPRVEIVEQSAASFDMGLELFSRRPHKAYSLTDCISMQTMSTRGLTRVLTNDHHFEQEGFEILIR